MPVKKKALFQADDAALKRGAISGCFAARTTRLKRSSWAIAVPLSIPFREMYTLSYPVDFIYERFLSFRPC